MAKHDSPDSEHLTLSETRSWLAQEVRDLAKSLELRVQEASAITAAFAAGEISAAEATDRVSKYRQRWDEALPGVQSGESMRNDQILKLIDEARHPEFAKRLIQKNRVSQIRKGEQETSR